VLYLLTHEPRISLSLDTTPLQAVNWIVSKVAARELSVACLPEVATIAALALVSQSMQRPILYSALVETPEGPICISLTYLATGA
jgi:hypothetical protein